MRTIRRVEYEVRIIDQYGDAIDVFFFDERRAAMRALLTYDLTGSVVAVALERAVKTYHRVDRALLKVNHELLAKRGDQTALALWQGEEAAP